MLNCIIATLCEESHGGREANHKMVTWLDNRLKSLRPQLKQEWSEEDKVMLGKVFECIRFAEDRYQLEEEQTNGVSVKSWLLAHINHQPHWKPSEEQMEALWCATEKYLESDNEKVREIKGKVLESLYNDLQKL